jgi:hypothetical protein
MKEEKQPDVILTDTTFTLPLECKLTDQDVVAKADEYAVLDADIEKLELELKSIKDDYNSKIKKLQCKAKGILHCIKTKTEVREVVCSEEKDFVSDIATTYRSDTGEKVRTRKLTMKEIQMDLPIDSSDSKN